MNTDEIGSAVRKLLVVAFTGLATKYHIEGNTITAIAADVVDLGTIIWGIYAHWNMVKVPEAAAPTVAAAKKVI